MLGLRDGAGPGAGLRNVAAASGFSAPYSMRALLTREAGVSTLAVEGATGTVGDLVHTRTDNPELSLTVRLGPVHSELNGGPVPQQVRRRGSVTDFLSCDVRVQAWAGEGPATAGVTDVGSVDLDAPTRPDADGDWSADGRAEVTLRGRGLRVGYVPISVRASVLDRRGGRLPQAPAPIRVALDPRVLLVPVQVIQFVAPGVGRTTSLDDQLLLWDQVPTPGELGSASVSDGQTGEFVRTSHTWAGWPTRDGDGSYTARGWQSPEAAWGQADVRFRLVNYFEFETDAAHVIPRDVRSGDPYGAVHENADAAARDPRYREGVLTVLHMNRIGGPSAPGIGKAMLGRATIAVAGGAADRHGVLAHEIGHLIMNTGQHSREPDNVLNDPGPGIGTTAAQRDRARVWAAHYAGFWRRP